jgi:hypothetical protein
MAQGRANKSAQKASPTPINTPTSGETINQNNDTNTFTIEEPKEEKKKSSGIWWLAGFVAVVTLGAVVMKRD